MQAELRISRRLAKLSTAWRASWVARDKRQTRYGPLMDSARGLGPVYRLNIIACVLGMTRRPFGDRFEAHISGGQIEADAASRPGPGRLTRYMQPNQTRRPDEEVILTDALVMTLCQQINALRTGLGRTIEASELFAKGFHDVNAVDRYRRWLTEELEPLIDDTELFGSTYTFFLNPERKVTYAELRKLIFNPEPGVGPLVLNPHAVGMWRGLTALAHKLCHEKGEGPNGRQLPVCYIPILKRHEHSHTNIALIVAALVAFYKAEPIIGVKRLDRWSSIRKAVAWLRTRMSEQACLIVLDAYWASDVKESALEVSRVIRDDYVLQLIAWLFEAPVGPPDGVVDLAEWRRNRIVILTERSLKPDEQRAAHEDIHPELRRLHTVSMRVGQPDEGDMQEIIEDHDLRHTETVMTMRKQYGLLESKKSESIFRALDALLTVFAKTRDREYQGDLSDEVQAAIEAAVQKQTRGGGDVLEAIVRALLLRLREKRPAWWLALRLIALTPSGLQRPTLGRLLSAIGSNNVAMKLLGVGARDISAWHDGEDDFLQTLDKVLDDNIADDFDGFGDPEDMSRSNRAIDFTIPAVRKVIVEDLYSGTSSDAACALNRYLSEESLSQQSLAFRRSNALRSDSIRPYRRLIGAIYHGLLSLPFDEMGRFGKPPVEIIAPAIPNDPVEAWYYLRIVLLRTVLERAPYDWALSRTYAMDRLKLALLEGFEAPWAWRPRGELPRQMNVFASLRELAEKSPQQKWQLDRVSTIEADHRESKSLVRYSALKPDADPPPDRRGFKRWADHQLMSLEIVPDDPEAGRHLELAIDKRIAEALGAGAPKEGEKRAKKIYDHIRRGKATLIGYVTGVTDDQTDLDDYVRLTIRYLQSILEDLGDEPAKILREVIDLLNRRAEVPSLRAALNDSVRASQTKLPKHRDLVLHDYCMAYAFYAVSEEVRLLARRVDALGNNARVSGHATRSAIRVSLKLQKLWRKAHQKAADQGRFAAYARQMADVLARSSQNPRERARLLVLDATIERLGRPEWHIDKRKRNVDDPNRLLARDALIRARAFLKDAEAITTGLSGDLRLSRQRFTEAVKINRELARIHAFDNRALSRRYLDMAWHDVDQLQAIAKDMVQPFWIAQAHLLELRVKEIGPR